MQYEVFEDETHAFVGKDPTTGNARRAMQLVVDFVHAQSKS